VIVEASSAFLPLRERVGLGRQRLERRALDLIEEYYDAEWANESIGSRNYKEFASFEDYRRFRRSTGAVLVF
jgi:hypothetical protein